MSLHIQIPQGRESERRYILSVILGAFLGIEFTAEISDRTDWKLSADDDREMIISDEFLSLPQKEWLRPEFLPKQPLETLNIESTDIDATVVTPQVPVIFGKKSTRHPFISASECRIELGIDIFGSCFFMLTRYEEAVKCDRDHHDRFPAAASLAFQEGFLNRPIVNEYVEILWSCMKRLWPGLERKRREFRLLYSCDVDKPYKIPWLRYSELCRHFAAEIFKATSPTGFCRLLSSSIQAKRGDVTNDPFNTFNALMTILESNGYVGTFYFFADRTDSNLDGRYRLENPLITNLLRKIYKQGHEIGLHTTYHSYRSVTQTKKEFEHLEKYCKQEDIRQVRWGSRQHFLRWETPTTLQNLEDAGLDYDTSLTFADMAGFRCGTCYEYSTFNVRTRKALRLRERPLVIMEGTVLDDCYMGIPVESGEALDVMAEYKRICRMFSGDFTLLWHNNRLADPKELELFSALLSA